MSPLTRVVSTRPTAGRMYARKLSALVLAVFGDQPTQSPVRSFWRGRLARCHRSANSATVIPRRRGARVSTSRPVSTALISSARRASANLAPARLSGATTVS